MHLLEKCKYIFLITDLVDIYLSKYLHCFLLLHQTQKTLDYQMISVSKTIR